MIAPNSHVPSRTGARKIQGVLLVRTFFQRMIRTFGFGLRVNKSAFLGASGIGPSAEYVGKS